MTGAAVAHADGAAPPTREPFRQTLWRVIVSPPAAMRDLGRDPRAGLKGAGMLAIVSAVYTLVLLVFLWRDYPAAAPSALPLATDEQYAVQLWYQVPLFLAATAAGALLLHGIAQRLGARERYGVAFGRIAFAMTTPFALTTMLIEAGLALLLAMGLLEPTAVVDWLLGEGAWFPLAYQLVALGWIALLLVLAVRASLERGWGVVLASSALIAVVYGLPVGLLIR